MPNFTPSVQLVVPAWRKTSKSASEKIKYLRFALRAMLPVKVSTTTGTESNTFTEFTEAVLTQCNFGWHK